MAVPGETVSARPPDYLGCMLHCPASAQLREDLTASTEASRQNEDMANHIIRETKEFIEGNPCDFIKSGSCRLVEYLSRTTIASRIILDAHDIHPGELIGENNGREEV